MTLNEAYKILGISSSANEKEVKRVYRKLAMIYHPDKNSAPNAKEKFVEVHDAYEVITNPNKQTTASYSTSSTTNSRRSASHSGHHFRSRDYNFSASNHANRQNREETYEERYERARKAAEEFEDKKSNKIYEAFLDDYRNSWKRKWVRMVAVAAGILAFIFTMDQILPSESHTASLRWGQHYFGQDTYYISFDGYEYNINHATYLGYHNKPSIVVYKTTPIFKDLKSANIVLPENNTEIPVNLGLGAATSFPLVPLLLLYPALSFFVERPKFNFVFFNIHFNIYGIPAFLLFLLLHEGRLERVFGG